MNRIWKFIFFRGGEEFEKNIEIQSNLKYMDLMHYFQIRFCVLVVRKQVITSQHMKH